MNWAITYFVTLYGQLRAATAPVGGPFPMTVCYDEHRMKVRVYREPDLPPPWCSSLFHSFMVVPCPLPSICLGAPEVGLCPCGARRGADI